MENPAPVPPGMTREQIEGMRVSEGQWRQDEAYVCKRCRNSAWLHPYTNLIWGCKHCGYTSYSVSVYFADRQELAWQAEVRAAQEQIISVMRRCHPTSLQQLRREIQADGPVNGFLAAEMFRLLNLGVLTLSVGRALAIHEGQARRHLAGEELDGSLVNERAFG